MPTPGKAVGLVPDIAVMAQEPRSLFLSRTVTTTTTMRGIMREKKKISEERWVRVVGGDTVGGVEMELVTLLTRSLIPGSFSARFYYKVYI